MGFAKLKKKWKGYHIIKWEDNTQKYNTCKLSDEGFLSRLYKELVQLNNKQTAWFKNGKKDLNITLSKEDSQCPESIKKCSMSLVIREKNQNHNKIPLNIQYEDCNSKTTGK